MKLKNVAYLMIVYINVSLIRLSKQSQSRRDC